ncbi:Hypothetical predicted protein [Marmota monax]|uniref:Uncharacterized protein n=1 Tax=Marmota monax TaxID=9995 RepID=A0A5E4C3M5_MARMO|nr:hypothetical protein GHT09_012201 [Marmota monax]VTJ76246.1 Hypothetical predicted protein [Marmota monax]
MVRVPDCCWLGTWQVSLAFCPLLWPYMGLKQWCVEDPPVAWGCEGQRPSEGPNGDMGPASGDSLRGESGQPVERLKAGKRGTDREERPPVGAGRELEGAEKFGALRNARPRGWVWETWDPGSKGRRLRRRTWMEEQQNYKRPTSLSQVPSCPPSPVPRPEPHTCLQP